MRILLQVAELPHLSRALIEYLPILDQSHSRLDALVLVVLGLMFVGHQIEHGRADLNVCEEDVEVFLPHSLTDLT